MNPLLVRTILVVGAFGLVGTGAFAAVPGVVRVVAVAAGFVLAVLDRLVVAGDRSRASEPAVALLEHPTGTRAPGAAPPEPPSTVPGPDRSAALVVGHRRDDGSPILTAAAHLVVVGRGALARGVFDALSAQLGAVTVAAASRHSDDLPDGLTPLPEGTAVHVAPPDDDHDLRTLVLVPDHGRTPRRTDAVVTVGRSGCTFRTARGEPIATAPVLPLLDLPVEGVGTVLVEGVGTVPVEGVGAVPVEGVGTGRVAGAGAVPVESVGTVPASSAGSRPAEPAGTAPQLSADRRRRGRRPPGRPHRAPARPSPP